MKFRELLVIQIFSQNLAFVHIIHMLVFGRKMVVSAISVYLKFLWYYIDCQSIGPGFNSSLWWLSS